VSAKQLLRLVVIFGGLLLVWGATALARRGGATDRRDELLLPSINRASVDTVRIWSPRDSIVLARKDSTTWTANGHPASAQAITDLFDALADTSSGSELIAEQKSSHPSLGVDSANGTRVRIGGGGRAIAALVVGRKTSDGGYVRRDGGDSTWLAHGRLVDVLSRGSSEWRDRRIATVHADSIASIEVSRGSKSYLLQRADNGWSIKPHVPADSSQAASLVSAYRSIEATDFATAAQADSAHFTSPDRRARLLHKNGTPILTLLFDSTAGGFWVRSDTAKAVYRIDTWTADRLTPADSTLRRRRH
jgi:Domain of unknown function (DUF4340)